jgi:nucleotide-binding universal stress UspA family protein
MFKHILIPTDGSTLSRKTVEAGIQLAKTTGAKVTGLFAAPAATPLVYRNFLPVGYKTPQEHERAIARTAERVLTHVEQAAKKAGVECSVVNVTNDFPADAIMSHAKKRKCDLIFMASHGRKGLSNLLGSETQKVVTQSGIPVLVYK